MTREEALKRVKGYLTDYISADCYGEVEEIIEALDQQPCEDWCDVPSDEMTLGQARQAVKDLREKLAEYLDQAPCKDAISRQAAKLKVASVTWDDGDSCYDFHDKCVDCLDDLPPVTLQPKIGRWYSTTIQGKIDGQIVKAFVCSECGAISVFRMADGKIVNGDLCPNCGAKMQEAENDIN